MPMSYTSRFLESKGQTCTILRTTPVSTKVSVKRATKSTGDLAVRDSYWEGLILVSANLASGEVFDIGGKRFLAQTVETDYTSGETHFFATKVNATLVLQRYQETLSSGNIIQQWVTVNSNIPAFGEIVTSNLRQYDPGLLPNTKYLFQIPRSTGVQLLDRIVYNGNPYQVDSVDDIMLAGIVRIQCSTDTRA